MKEQLAFDLTWRSLGEADLPALAALARACFEADGGLPLGVEESFLAGRYLPGPDGANTGAFTPDGALLAAAALRFGGEAGERSATLVGMVHPMRRRQDIGTYLMDWSLAQAAEPAGPQQVKLRVESLSPAAERLYATHGFEMTFIEHVMRFDLTMPLPDAPLPAGVTIEPWTAERAPQFFAAYEAAFRERPGFPGWSAEEWIAWISDDEDFRPDLALLAPEDGQPLGFIAASPGWITEVGTHPAARGRGIGSALMRQVMERMRREGTPAAELAVNANNPGAVRLYEQLGFAHIGRRGLYTQPFRVRYAIPADNRLLAEVGAETFSDSFGAQNTPENMRAYLAGAFSPDIQARELADPQTRFLLIEEADGTVAGYARLRFGVALDPIPGEKPVEISRFYARKAWIGRGVGAKLMQACLREARLGGCDTLWLDVWEENPRAIAFYRKWGFEQVGTQTFLLGKDVQHDLLMAMSVFQG